MERGKSGTFERSDRLIKKSAASWKNSLNCPLNVPHFGTTLQTIKLYEAEREANTSTDV